MISTTPKSVNEGVLLLRTKLGLHTEPVFVPVRDTAGHKINDCYYNVARKIKADGGHIQHGWTVWETPGKFIEAEFHAVWVSPPGELIDITPHADRETQILFIPDPVRVYTQEPVDNVRLALCDDPAIHAMIRAGERMTELRAQYNDGTGESRIPIHALRPALAPVRNAIKAGRNDPCPCGSGKKFKRCHGALH